MILELPIKDLQFPPNPTLKVGYVLHILDILSLITYK
jgi:hypothetical protein